MSVGVQVGKGTIVATGVGVMEGVRLPVGVTVAVPRVPVWVEVAV